jgi:hypothetical protein
MTDQYHGTAKHCDGIPQLTARIRELEAERDALRVLLVEAERYAEMYKWIRKNPTWIGFDADVWPEQIDYYVFKAMKKL